MALGDLIMCIIGWTLHPRTSWNARKQWQSYEAAIRASEEGEERQ